MRQWQHPQMAPDWGRLIAEVVASGLTHADVGIRMGAVLTQRMLRHYAIGVQPLHFRGEALIVLWCERLARARTDLPMVQVQRGHRASRTVIAGPKLQSLPDWPPPVQHTEMQGKKRRKKEPA
jgi:hypothetical protein